MHQGLRFSPFVYRCGDKQGLQVAHGSAGDKPTPWHLGHGLSATWPCTWSLAVGGAHPD